MLAHASFWFFPVLLPLVLFLACRRTRPWPAAHAADAFNFQVTVTAVCLALLGVASVSGSLGAVAVLALVVIWISAIAATAVRVGAAGDDTLRPYRVGVPLLHRPRLTEPTPA